MTSPTYRWRKLNDADRLLLVDWRLRLGRPSHSPLHRDNGAAYYHLTAACYEHRPHIGFTPERMTDFTERLMNVLCEKSSDTRAWVVLPNHYHALVYTGSILALLKALGRLHGSTSFHWNGEEQSRGRQVWCNAAETQMKSDAHLCATVNYIHHNPVKHGYVQRWLEWPWSSAEAYLATVGRKQAARDWELYPIDEYGRGWDDPEL